jgi:hypothetical protein
MWSHYPAKMTKDDTIKQLESSLGWISRGSLNTEHSTFACIIIMQILTLLETIVYLVLNTFYDLASTNWHAHWVPYVDEAGAGTRVRRR